jgi:hypothetical protein
VDLLAWLISTVSWLYSKQTDTISIKQDIETGHRVSDEIPLADQIKPRIEDLQTSTSYVYPNLAS